MPLRIRELTKRFGDVVAVDDVDLTADDDDFLVLLGPSGSGKTTTLRMVAGLETPSEGDIYIGDREVSKLEPADRDIAMVFQNYALYPHLTVEENISLGLKVAGVDQSEIDQRVQEALRILGIENLVDRKPSELSGGQQQRVALGRSIVRDPSVFLMDEPLSNLDARLRTQMRKELKELKQRLDTTFVYVTHDQTEAMTMATNIAVLEGGKLQQVGSPEALYDRPTNEFVAQFIGSPSMNLFDATREADDVLDLGCLSYQLSSEQVEALDAADNGRLRLGIRPEDVRLGKGGQDTRVKIVEPVGSDVLAYLEIDEREIVIETQRDRGIKRGDVIQISFPPEKVHLFNNGDRISTDSRTVGEVRS